MVVISVYTYGVKIIKKFRWESGFLWGGFHGTPPLCTNGSAGYLMQLSVNYTHIRTKCYAIAATVLFVLFPKKFSRKKLSPNKMTYNKINSNVV